MSSLFFISTESESDAVISKSEPYYEPIITQPLVNYCQLHTNEEEEEELVKMWAKLYRYNMSDHEWKERGTGEIKLLCHKLKNTVRVVMRRDKTFKICANHYVTPHMRMNVHCGSEVAFNWFVFAEFADEIVQKEALAIKFEKPQMAQLWQSKFEEAQQLVRTKYCSHSQDQSSDDQTNSS